MSQHKNAFMNWDFLCVLPGVCVNCRHNTEGQRCDQCIKFYYREVGKSLFDEDVCSPCECNTAGVIPGNLECEKVGGNCSCKANVGGRSCDRCKDGYFNMQPQNPNGCLSCGCNTAGTTGASVTCNQDTGRCSCKPKVQGI